MDLPETFRKVAPGIVAFAQTRIENAAAVPLSPLIFGTGFIVDSDGIVATNRHVIEHFDKLPKDAETGKAAVGCLLCHYDFGANGKAMVRLMPIKLKYWTVLESFVSDGQWYGEDIPDIGFAQLMLKDVPALPLAHENNYIETGMPIGTAGYPMGHVPLTVMKKLNQLMPFLRRGIVSSIFPFDIEQPHGFTIDILQQGGSSGSPVFRVDKPEVVGMMAASMTDYSYTSDGDNTNISICVAAGQIVHALNTFKTEYPPKIDEVMTLEERLATIPAVEPGTFWGVTKK